MIGWDSILYAFVCGALLTASAMGLESAAISSSLDRQGKRFFISFYAVLTLGFAAFFLELAAYVVPDLMVLEVIAYYIQSLFCVVPFLLVAAYLLDCCGEDWRHSPFFFAMLVLWAAYFALLSISQFTTLFYYITPDGQDHYGPAYPLIVMSVLAMLLLDALGVVRRRGKLSRGYYRAFLICLVPVMLALVVHLLISAFILIDAGLLISAIAMRHIIEFDSAEQIRRQQREIAKQQASISVLRMRPHFIYNTMTTIYYLCDQDPELAKQVTMDFTSYLRKNFAAIASEEVVPFADELEHTRAYLAVEQAQFADDLSVDFDTPHIQFSVPPLTLQPLAENAVKHGMDPDAGPLHIWVRTRETGSGSEVVVEDDGPGFDAAVADNPHSTLANIRARLDMMCGGRLDIEPRAGDGTVVKITVPRQPRA